ncbi:restriction endonuclease subunit R [Burkholderia pseudomultivorans]|uniref:type I restriction endonuclease subunit R n=1 Tax=Burkholderia pseudomultivorans TaxID=1207504 RepID=UPI000759DD57|nr:type I restriction endonuclease subunit R [Burkholderia pseudomultivorans]KVC42482.1 restriction endonuclease subunit R [Burkholderia pseudomultivorans]
MPDTEAQTRTRRIDADLARAGWSGARRNLVEEHLLHTGEPDGEYGGRGFADYVLLDRAGTPIAVVEAKRSSRDELAGKHQAAEYADAIRVKYGIEPFIYLTNGREIQFWDRGRYAPRRVTGFHTREDLERLIHQKRYAQRLGEVAIDPSIAGRDYQVEAIRRVAEDIEAARRRFLLVMATGTGKTRTTIALADLLLRAKRVQRILFLADRRELVRQAMTEFKTHLPHESLARIESGEAPIARIHFATYPSMMQVYERLSVGHYDLVIADESHRSIYQRYGALLNHFDALVLGLTATPTDYIDHNTFQLFACDDGLPTYLYSYEQAVGDGNLVNYRVLDAQTQFQIRGIQGDALPEPLRQMAHDQGVDLEELDFEGSALEKSVINHGTNDAIVLEFMTRCRKDARGMPHKTIVFAVSHAHAKRLYESFNRLYPELQRQGLAEIIDSHMERADALLDDFKFRSMPRVAISVDMLDTGVDVPGIQNLVFAKPVFSRVKFWQMIGRGTRLYTDPATGEKKSDFLIIDHWKNFAYFQLNPEGDTESPSEPLPVRLFRMRLERWQLEHVQQRPTDTSVLRLQTMLAALPRQSIDVRPHVEELDRLAQHWPEPQAAAIEHLSHALAPLLRLVPGQSIEELQWRSWCERAAIAYVQGNAEELARLQQRIQDALRQLAQDIPEVRAQAEPRAFALSSGFWQHLDLPRVDALQDRFAPLMRFRIREGSKPIEINLPDRIVQRSWIIYGPTGEGAFAENYRAQVEAWVRRLAAEHPALAKLKRGDSLSDEEIEQIAEALNQADLFITADTLRQTFDAPQASLAELLRHILCEDARLPDREARVQAAFNTFIAAHPGLRANQLSFLRAVKAAVLRHGRITRAALSQPPLANVGRVEALFAPHDIDELIAIAERLASARAA